MKKPLIALGAVMLGFIVFVYAMKPVADSDLFWHLATGKWIVEHRELPKTDPFAYTTHVKSENAKATLKRYWLSQVLMYMVYLAGGCNGVVVSRFAVIALMVYLLYLRRGESDMAVFLFVTSLAMVMYLRSFPVERPHTATFALFALLLYIMDVHRSGGYMNKALPARALVWLSLPAMMLLWANMHIGFILGQALIVVFMVTEGAKLLSPRLGDPMQARHYRAFALSGTAAVIAAFINPNAFKGFQNLFYQQGFTYAITEWESTVDTYRNIFTPQLFVYWAMLAASVIVFAHKAILRRRFDLTELVLLAGLGYESFTTMRMVPLFLIFAVPYLASGVGGPSRWRKSLGAAAAIAAAGVFIYFMIALGDLGDVRNASKFRTGDWVINTLPEKGVRFIIDNSLSGRMYNTFDWGGYLIWRLYPERQVFVDNRVMDKDIFMDAIAIASAKENPKIMGTPYYRALMSAYSFDYMVIKLYDTRLNMLPIVSEIFLDPKWVAVFNADNTLIFVRRTAANREVIEKHSNVHRSILASQIRDLDDLIRRSPGHPSLWLLKAKVQELAGDIEGARRTCRALLAREPGNSEAAERLNELNASHAP